MAEAPLLLEAGDIAKRFGSVVALRAAELRIRAGEVHALMGANGAGKSTLVKMLTGALRPDAGTIAIRGTVQRFRSPAEARDAGLVSVYQDPALVPDLTIGQNLRLAGAKPDKVRRWLAELGLDGLSFSELVRDLPLPTLRLADLARALAAEPDILLLDEITAALPADLAERVFEVVRQWRDLGHSVIFISHRLAEVSALCARATVLRDGVTVGVVEPAQGGEEEIVALMLGPEQAGAGPARPRADTAPTGEPTAKPVAEGDPGHAARHGDEPPALAVRGLRAGPLLRDVGFSLRPGEVLGIAALEGQGQDELFACLAGLRRPENGAITAHGRALRLRHPADAVRSGLVLVPADRLHALLHQRSVHENIALPMVRRARRWGLLPLRHERSHVEAAVQRLQIDTRAAAQVRQLSGGNQQKVVIARWLACGFKTLLCFDPTRGIDIGTKRQIYALVRDLAASGAAVLLFSSELPELQLTCDRVIVLFGGVIVQEMPAGEADEASLLRAAHGLTPRAPARS